MLTVDVRLWLIDPKCVLPWQTRRWMGVAVQGLGFGLIPRLHLKFHEPW